MSNNLSPRKSAPSSALVNTALVGIAGIWAVVLLAIIAGLVVFWERTSQAQQPVVAEAVPVVMIQPSSGPLGTLISMKGAGWKSGGTVMVYVQTPSETTTASYASASAAVDSSGQFSANLIIPDDARFEGQSELLVIARDTSGLAAQAVFEVKTGSNSQAEIPVTGPNAAPTATLVISGTAESATATPTATTTITSTTDIITGPRATATINLYVHSGPGTGYPVIGVLPKGIPVTIVGVSTDKAWWQIYDAGIPTSDYKGWISANYVIAEDTANVPVVNTPILSATTTPTAAPAAGTGSSDQYWKGEYFNNPNLSGSPVLVRNDAEINFNWGTGSPDASIPVDNFSARWTRNVYFTAGTYNFTATVDDGVRLYIDGKAYIDQWRDGSSTAFTTNVYLSEGSHNIRMEYYERGNFAAASLTWAAGTGSSTTTVSGSQAPYAHISADSSADEDEKVKFKATDSTAYNGATITRYYWDFDDDENAEGYEVHHRFDDDGTYHVKLTVTDSNGMTATTEKKIKIHNKSSSDDNSSEVTAAISGPSSGQIGQSLSFSGASSSTTSGSIISYHWDFGDGASASGVSASHTYVSAGNYTVSLVVVDSYSHTGSTNKSVSITSNQNPVASFTVSGTEETGQQLTLNGSASHDPDGSITKYEWDFNYNGSTFNVDSSGSVANKIYYAAGTYTIALRVTDNASATNITTHSVTITGNVAPTASFTVSGTEQVGEELSLDGTGSSDSDGTISSYEWDFDYNGSTFNTDATGSTTTHTYDTAGTYTIALRVTDDDSATDITTHDVEIASLGSTGLGASALSVATSTPTPTATHTPEPTATVAAVSTATPIPTATHTPVPTATATATATATHTPEPTATNTLVPTATPIPTATNTPQPTPTPIPPATNTPMPTATPIPTATNTPEPTATPK